MITCRWSVLILMVGIDVLFFSLSFSPSYSMCMYNTIIIYMHWVSYRPSVVCSSIRSFNLSCSDSRVFFSSLYFLRIDDVARRSSRLHTNEKEVKEQRVISGHE